jgi:hypothetical protein
MLWLHQTISKGILRALLTVGLSGLILFFYKIQTVLIYLAVSNSNIDWLPIFTIFQKAIKNLITFCNYCNGRSIYTYYSGIYHDVYSVNYISRSKFIPTKHISNWKNIMQLINQFAFSRELSNWLLWNVERS